MNDIESIIEQWRARYSGYMPAKDQEVVKWLEEVFTNVYAKGIEKGVEEGIRRKLQDQGGIY